MALRFNFDPLSWIKNQLNKDAERNAREKAKALADPAIAARISEYRARYPHLTPGVLLPLAKANSDPDGEEVRNLAYLSAQLKISKGKGWYSPKDDPNYKNDVNTWFKQTGINNRQGDGVLEAFKPFTRATAALGQTGVEAVGALARAGANLVENGSDAALAGLKQEKFTAWEAAKGIASGDGAGLGKGYFAKGRNTELQAESARTAYSLEYADTPLFGSLNQKPVVERHAGTTGRIVMKTVTQPGSFWFNIGSGIIDGIAALYTDPAAKIGKVAGEFQASRKLFTAEEAGRTAGANLIDDVIDTPAPTDLLPFTAANEDPTLSGLSQSQISAELSRRMGLVSGRRNTVHAPTFRNWLTSDRTGRKFVKSVAEEDSAFTIWKQLGGEEGKFDPLLARQMADAHTEQEVVSVLSPQLGTGLAQKPSISSFTNLTGQFEGVGIRNNKGYVRLLQTMPHNAVDLDDVSESATQLTRYLRNFKTPESEIGSWFDQLTKAEDTAGRKEVFRLARLSSAQRSAEEIATSLGGKVTANLNRNFNILRGVFRRDDEILEEINRIHASRGTVVRNVMIDGELSNPLRSHFEDLEESSSIMRLEHPREVRRITSTYGRILNLPGIDQSVTFLDHINNLLKGVNILRPALVPRVHGEEHARMAVAGFDTMFNHPISYLAFLTGRKGASDVFGREFDGMGELSSFRKSLVKQRDLHTNLSMEHKVTIPYTDKRFAKAWADDLYVLNDDPVTRRLAGGFGADDIQTGNYVDDAKRWLASDDPEAVAYRAENSVTPDLLSAYVDNQHAHLLDRTFNNDSLKAAIATGTHNGEPIVEVGKNGPRLSKSFQAHLRSLNDNGLSPELSIGDIAPNATLEDVSKVYRHATDQLFSWLLTQPSNRFNRSITYKQQYWKSAGNELLVHASPEAQKSIIQSAIDNDLGKDAIKALRDIAQKGSGNLTLEEVDKFAQARAVDSVKSLFYDLADRNQLLDVMRLIWPFGEAWKEGITAWSKLARDRPQIIPRALMAVDGARDSGFFYTDPQTGEEMFAYPGGQFVTNSLFGIPSPITAKVQSLNMITGGGNPIMPGFGPLAQQAVTHILPDVPKWDAVREFISPYEPQDPENPFNFLPSWAQHLRDYIGSPAHEVAFANQRMDVMRYLVSTGQYDISSQAGQQALTDRATQLAKRLSLFRGLAQAVLPAAPSIEDIAKDKDGRTVTAFALVEDYRQLLEKDRESNTNLAASTFIEKYGEANLLYMQSATKGGDIFTKDGYDWVRENKDIASRYPDVYSLFAPNEGGFDLKAYHALFENGERKPLTPREALDAAQNRVAKMAYRNAQDKLPEPNKRTKAQKEWLRNVRDELLDQYPGFVPEFQGSDIPDTIRSLEEAVNDPKLSKNPQAQAIREYLDARAKVEKEALSRRTPVVGWQTAKSTRAQRAWLRDKAAEITQRYPSFKNINRELFDQELGEDD